MYVRLKLGNGCDDRLRIFKVAPGRPRDGLRRQKIGGLEYGARKLAFFIYRGSRWRGVSGTGQPYLHVGLATGGVNRVIHSATLRCGRAGSVRSLTGGRGTWGGRDVEQSLNYRYNAQLDGQNG